MINKKDLNKYYSSIKKNLSCSLNIKFIFIKELQERISDFLQDNPDSTMEIIIENFGTPEEIAKSFVDKDNEYYRKKAKKRLIFEIIFLIILIVVIAVSSFIIYSLIKNFVGGKITITTN